MFKKLIYYAFLFYFLLSCADSQHKIINKVTITAKDYFDKDIEIPIKVNRIMTMTSVTAEMISVIGAAKKIVGIGKLNVNRSPIIDNYFPELFEIPQFGNQGNINYEKIISLKPDFVFCDLQKNLAHRLNRLGIYNFMFYPKYPLQVSEQILLFGKILDKSDNAQKIVDFLNGEYDLVINRTNNLSENERPKVYYARNDLLTTFGQGINSDIINIVGGISVTKDVLNDIHGIKVTLENLHKWNPDIIIIRDTGSLIPEDLYKDVRLKGINAVENRKVFKETFSWTEFRIGMYFGMIEKAKWLHPDLFRDLEPKNEFDKFVKLFQSFSL